ncbi:MAG TPA: hypothetical protein VGW36_09335 [Pyrinomonadaceae bacterium]|nr:hypothetical protein [Pyrinomonadaceae bacterium]
MTFVPSWLTAQTGPEWPDWPEVYARSSAEVNNFPLDRKGRFKAASRELIVQRSYQAVKRLA